MDIKKISLLALFIALSVIGSFIKIPAVVGSIALDAFPALLAVVLIGTTAGAVVAGMGHIDRKSTRLNSSHVSISYAVFCLKKQRACRSSHSQGTTRSRWYLR